MPLPRPRDPRREATALLGDGMEARVLEPSPPAVTTPPWWADDPTDPTGSSRTVVSPTSDGDITWDEAVAADPGLRRFAADRWLGARRRLPDLPHGFSRTRHGLHQLAFFVVAPKRYGVTGKLGLRHTLGGFGTPFFGFDEQVRLDGTTLVHQGDGVVRTIDLDSLHDAARFLEIDYQQSWFPDFHDPPEPADPMRSLGLDPLATSVLADWIAFGTAVLEEMRRTDGAVDVTRVQLWPEHFDVAVEMGSGSSRAAYGASPGDTHHPEPYLYVAPTGGRDRGGSYWNAPSFGGATLGYEELRQQGDQYGAALAFLRQGHGLLAAGDE